MTVTIPAADYMDQGFWFIHGAKMIAGTGAPGPMPIAFSSGNDQMMEVLAIPGSPAPFIGDAFELALFIAAGTYTMYVNGVARESMGKISWYLNDEFLETQDWYSDNSGLPSSLDYNITKSIANVVIEVAGYNRLKGVIEQKNSASSNYAINLAWVRFVNWVDEVL